MARLSAEVIGQVDLSPADVWNVAGDFAALWHPLIESMTAERDPKGALVRAFTVKGEDTTYRERLVYRSDGDRVLIYDHLEGIEAVEHYRATFKVTPAASGGSEITWSAEIEAPEPRASAIKAGTEAIFRMGIEALAKVRATSAPPAAASRSATGPATLSTVTLAGEPTLALTVAGTDGPLVLFLHGIGGGRSNWDAQLQALGNTHRAAALDLRGYGDSMFGTEPSTIEAYCADILRVADHFGTERLVLCGLSYGSWIATSFAMRHPERLAGLVLSGGCTGMSEASIEERERFLAARQAPLDAGQTPADFAANVVSILAGPEADSEVIVRLRASMAAIEAATYRDAVWCFTHPPERFDFSGLTMPVLMMTGEFDRLASPTEIRSVAQRIAKMAPGASVRYETIAGAGHVCNVERPASYSAVLQDFLGDLPA